MKIFDFLVHEGHQYEFCKIECDFTIALDRKAGKFWDDKSRPVPQNAEFIDLTQLSKSFVETHDVAIIRNHKHLVYLRDCDIPKIIVMHCSKHGQGNPEFLAEDLSEYSIVFCSHKDKEQWNIPTGRQYVIYPGLDPNEWPISDRSVNRVFTVARMLKERNKYLGYSVVQDFNKSGIQVKVVGESEAMGTTSATSFEEFKRNHAKHSVYLNPTLKSPMPRGRVEAMMSGIPVVTTGFYDEEEFIENGVNGYCSNNIQELKEYALLLLHDSELQASVALKVRETAIRIFHIDRFLKEWRAVLEEKSTSIGQIPIRNARPMKVFMTKKDSSGGGGTVTSANVVNGLRAERMSVKCLDINSKGWVSFVDGIKTPPTGERIFENFIKKNPCDVIIFDDMARYTLCSPWLDSQCRIFLCLLGNPQVHDEHWMDDGVLNLCSEDNRIEKILCRPTYAKYLKALFGDDKIISWFGGCDGKKMREEFGQARYKHPEDGALIISAHRGVDWWKNPATAFLGAYGIFKKYPEIIYFKPSGSDKEKIMMRHSPWDVQYGGTQRDGMDRNELLKTFACAQLAIEPGYSEGFSRSCNEMMNMGIPVIQGPTAQHLRESDILSKYLLLKDPSDIQEIVDLSLVLLENKDVWEIVSKECIRLSAKYNTEQEVDTLVQALL